MMILATVAMVMPANAEGLLAVAPLRLMLSDSKTSELLTLTNRSEGVRTYKLVMQDEVMQPNGSIVQKDDFAYSAKRMLRFMPRQITLQPGQRQNVRVMAMLPDGVADGDYHTHLIFQQQKNEKVSSTTPDRGFTVQMESLYNIGIPVVVNKGAPTGKVSLDEAKLVTKGDKPWVSVTLGRTGNSEAGALLRVLDKATGEVVAELRTIRVYHEVDSVQVDIPFKPAYINAVQGKDLDVRLEDDGKVLDSKIIKG